VQEHHQPARVVVSPDLGTVLGDQLTEIGMETASAVCADGSLHPFDALDAGEPCVLVVSDADGLSADAEFWHAVRSRARSVRVIVVTERSDITAAVRIMKAGAYEVVPLSGARERLAASIASALQELSCRDGDPGPLTGTIPALAELVGEGPAMAAVRRTIVSVAASEAAVFIVGESGTGKELVARALHTCSPRSARPFLPVNCAALPRDILENELFGHERGAFTGALARKAGCFELASGGTLFLDEIGEMTPETQAKLLRVIEQQAFRRLGGKEEIQVDVRIIAATNRDVERSLEEGLLRTDLYYRLCIVEIVLPPLRDRPEDIPVLTRHFISMFSQKYGKQIEGAEADVTEMLRDHEWPGNVRELRNAVERAVVLCPGGTVQLHHLPDKLRKCDRTATHIRIPLGTSVEEAEQRLILETLAMVGNNKARAARILGVSRKTLHNKLNQFNRRGAVTPGPDCTPE
jgi:two-component system, NtrC family, response regulator HydG